MKLQKLSAFEKHFKESLSHHLSPVYVVACAQENERKKILASLTGLLKARFDLLKTSQMEQALQHLQSRSLFSQEMAALYDGVEQLLKGELEALTSYIRAPNEEGCLLLGASRLKEINALYKEGKSHMVILDLTKEKPWEEKERLTHWAVRYVSSEKKRISPDALSHLLAHLPSDRICIQNELDKLLCYVGDRSEISLKDIESISSEDTEISPYPLARSIIWEGGQLNTPLADVSLLLQLVGAIRSQLEIGLKMSSLLKRGTAHAEIESAFPKLYPKSLRQCLDGTKQKGESFFIRGLRALFELEFGLKSSQGRPDVLFARFCNHLD